MTPAYERNGAPVAREDFYRIACDPQRHVVVEACAGAGKTWMLVSRILRALLEGTAPQEILAITFTKKAAGEMRQRLMEWLEAFAQADDERLRQELLMRGVDTARVSALVDPLRQLHRSLLLQGRTVQIRTFHSWFAALLRNAPMAMLEELGFPAAYELLEQDAPAIAQLWRPFQARLLREPELRADYEAVIATHGRSQTEKALEAALQRRVEFMLADALAVIERSVPPAAEVYPDLSATDVPLDLLIADGALRKSLERAARLLGQASQPSFSAKGVELEQALTAGDAPGVLKALLTAEEQPRKFSDKLAGIEEIRAAQTGVLHLLEAQQQHEAWLYQQRMTRLSRLLIAEYGALKRERGWVDMSDVERAALHLLSDSALSGWVQERLDARTRHLLIDEFQDTNPLQWQALHAWLSGYGGSGGGATAPRLFIVGDPKQSIYRFRRAEPQVFEAAKAFVRELGGEQLSCDHTRRNAPEVLALVNTALGQAREAGEYEGFRTHSTESQQAGAVQALPAIARPGKEKKEAATEWRDSLTQPRHTPEDTLRERECRQAARWIAGQIDAGLHPGDIMVLARKRDRLSAMESELRALGIPALQPEKTELGEAPEVQDLVALLDVLVSPAHDLSLARALRSPLFGLPDQALIEIALRQRTHKLPWFDLLQQPGWSPALQDVGVRLQRWQQWVASLPPHDALDALYEDGDVLARFVAAAPPTLRAGVHANLQALLSAALQLDGGRYATPYGLVRALRAGGVPAPQAAGADAVQLLTVHGAKGLEAELVLLLDTDAPPQRAQTMGVLLDWPGEETAPVSFIFLASESRVPSSAREALEKEQQARGREELNTLYVALTRARQRLVLSSVQPYADSGSSWWQRLLPACEPLAVADLAAAPAPAQAQDAPIVLPVLPDVRFEAPRGGPTAPDEGTPEARIGQAMHRLLEWVALDAQGWSTAQVQRAAIEFGLDAAQAQQAAALARRILQGEGRWAWRSAEVDWQANEVPVTVQGSVRRIDRLVRRRDGHWWVLDYKSAARPQDQEDLQMQLRAYRAAVQAASPGEPVRAAFLSALGRVEEID
ncbi:MAG: UvrD-helicase domain-containing protein [Burkholderiaceae bacterium]|nr:UvrD-helicase domain-containing protein [Burkholderiaceae bacterium]